MPGLASWNDTATREAIVAFAECAAQSVPPEERVAVFDNDGTLWCEKPMPVELGFILLRLAGDGRGRTSPCARSSRGRPRTRRTTRGSAA